MLKRHRTDVWRYWALLGQVRLRQEKVSLREENGNPETVLSEENSILLMSSWFGIGIELRNCGKFLKIPRTLTYFQVLPYGSKIFNLHRHEGVKVFKQGLSRQEFSPFVRDSSGRTLLHYAAGRNNVEWCSLLIQIGVNAGETDGHGCKALDYVDYGSKSSIKIIRTLITAQDQFTVEDLSNQLDDLFDGSPGEVDFLFSMYDSMDETADRPHLDYEILKIGLRGFGYGKKEWMRMIRKEIYQNTDIHARSLPISGARPWEKRYDCRSWKQRLRDTSMTYILLDELFISQEDQFEAVIYGQEWLLVLSEAGYDINEYLKGEEQIHSAQHFHTYPLLSGV